MPFYDFKNTETGEVETLMLTVGEREEYLKENSHLQQVHLQAPATVRGTGGMKNDDGWKENLARIAEAHPTSALAERQGGRKTKQVKTQEALKKHTSVLRGGTNYGLDKVK